MLSVQGDRRRAGTRWCVLGFEPASPLLAGVPGDGVAICPQSSTLTSPGGTKLLPWPLYHTLMFPSSYSDNLCKHILYSLLLCATHVVSVTDRRRRILLLGSSDLHTLG